MWFIHVYRPLSGTSVGQLAYLVRGREAKLLAFGPGETFQAALDEARCGKTVGLP